MGAGRFVCVALPLLLTIGSIISLLIAALSGVVHNNLYVFRVDVTDLSIDPASVKNIASDLGLNLRAAQTSNITAADLGLGDTYDVNLWGYCYTKNDKRTCTKAKFNWAASDLNTTYLEDFGSAAGVKIELPKEVRDALKVFRIVTKWTEVAFIIALVLLGVELIIGILSNFSRVISCCTWLESCVTTCIVFAAAGLATGMAAVVVGTVDSTAKFYGVHGGLNTQFLATIWISAAFSLAATLFWIFTICCCKPEHRSGTKHRDSYHDGEKLLPTRGYAPLNHEHEMAGYNNQSPYGQHNQQYQAPSHGSDWAPTPRYAGGGAGRSDLAYEPYSHRA